MNRSDLVRAIVACDVLGKELRAQLNAEAEAEHAEQGMAPTWREPGITVTAGVTHDRVEVTDEAALVEYLAEVHPSEVEVVRRPRPAFLPAFLADLVSRGDPPCDRDGRLVPGVAWRPGGEYRSVSVRPTAATLAGLRAHARDIAAGRRPLSLPGGEPDEA